MKYYLAPRISQLDDGTIYEEGWIYQKNTNDKIFRIRSLMLSELRNSFRTRCTLLNEHGIKNIKEFYDVTIGNSSLPMVEITLARVKKFEKKWKEDAKKFWK
jgi:hypothetical protein